ncbi:MAG: metallophosphoesterase [Bdellovibrionales bacterium]|nr:metallophosphoesterase [Bdellovibrionales bacterium]
MASLNLTKKFVILAFFLCSLAWARVYTFAVLGDAGVWDKHTKDIRKSIRNSADIHRLILPGDNLYDLKQSYFDVWSNWAGFSFSAVAIGNHTLGYKEEVEFFRLPGEYYTRVWGNDVLLIVLNSDNENSVDEQMIWLEGQLKVASQQFVALIYHHPTYTVSANHAWKEKKRFQNRLRDILRRYADKIDLIINGHDHIASLVELDGKLPMLISGASFESRHAKPVDYKAEDGTSVKTRWLYEDGSHWTRLDFNTEEGDVWINFVDAKLNKVECSIRAKDHKTTLNDNCIKG